MNSVWLLHNRRAGQPGYARQVEQAAEALTRRGVSVTLQQRPDVPALQQAARDALAASAGAVLVAGGDGTLGAIAGELAGSAVPLGALPAGTANVWAQTLGLPRPRPLRRDALEQAALQLLDAPARATDMGRCNGAWFLVWAGVGLDAFVTQEFEQQRQVSQRLGGFFYNVGLTFYVARAWRGVDLRLRASGSGNAFERAGHFLMVTVCNIGLHGGGLFRFARDIRLDDGLMDMWAFEGSHYGQALRLAWAVQREKHLGYPGVHRLTGDHFEIEAAAPQAIQTDGEPRPPVPLVTLQVVPRALQVLVPRGSPGELYQANGSSA